MSADHRFFQFNYIPYPLWRRKLPFLLKPIARAYLSRHYPVSLDLRPIPTVNDVADYLIRFKLLPDMSEADLRQQLMAPPTHLTIVDLERQPATSSEPVRLPAQWEPMERIIITWAQNFPPLWALHAAMVEAISAVADVQINVNHPVWANAVNLYLRTRGKADLDRVRFFHLPTNDIWVRDYGPFVGLNANGERGVVKMIYDPLPNYPQAEDDQMPTRIAAHEGFPLQTINFHGEGGNLWTDGAGTLIMTNQAFRLNPEITRPTLLEQMHRVFQFEKLIITPRLRIEETGHVDLLMKLANANTLLMSSPPARLTTDRLRGAIHQLKRETNAAGERYQLVMLPTPPLYLNWFGYPIRRSYTNALTVNGRVLVPTYSLTTDDDALRIYAETMPDHEVIPIDCTIGANGGGAVHCMTKEVPRPTAH